MFTHSLGQLLTETEKNSHLEKINYPFTVNKCKHVYDLLTTMVCGEELGHYSPSVGIISQGQVYS